MWSDAHSRHTDRDCQRLVRSVLLEPEALIETLAPEGWSSSALHHAFHPTPDRRALEREQLRQNLRRLRAHGASAPPREHGEPDSEPDLEDLAGPPRPIEPEREVVQLVGYALWDVFSDNHSVIDNAGVEFHLGSFRGSAAFIADEINRRYDHLGDRYHYMAFYMGSSLVARRTDMLPVYVWMFGVLSAKRCRWIYSFPRLYLLGVSQRVDGDFTDYDPSDAFHRQLDEAERTPRIRELAEELERLQDEALSRARHEPLPATVAAYRQVYGALPEGWPHPEM
jgi:hypothetical protein